MNIPLRYKLSLVGVVYLLSLLLVFRMFHHSSSGGTSPSHVVLPPDDVAKVYASNNRLVVQTQKGITSQYVPENATVEIKKNGEVLTHVQEVGLSHDPYVGLSVGDKPRLQVGMNLLYANRISLGTGIGFGLDRPDSFLTIARLNVNVSYNIYRDTRVFIGVDHTGALLGGVQIKL